jgi:hypothetical protein
MAMFLVGWANFMIFMFVSLYVGGDAYNGKIEDGRYYLKSVRSKGSPAPEPYKEVSGAIFRFSWLHAYTVFVTFPLGLLAAWAAHHLENRKEL